MTVQPPVETHQFPRRPDPASEAPEDPDHQRGQELAWCAIEPRQVLAWDYGTLRAS